MLSRILRLVSERIWRIAYEQGFRDGREAGLDEAGGLIESAPLGE